MVFPYLCNSMTFAGNWTKVASRLALRCREKGITVPISNIVFAACAVTHKLELEHCDKHFDELLPLAKAL